MLTPNRYFALLLPVPLSNRVMQNVDMHLCVAFVALSEQGSYHFSAHNNIGFQGLIFAKAKIL